MNERKGKLDCVEQGRSRNGFGFEEVVVGHFRRSSKMKKATTLMLVAIVLSMANGPATADLWTDNFDTGETVGNMPTNWNPNHNAGNCYARITTDQYVSSPNSVCLCDDRDGWDISMGRNCDTLSAGVLEYDVLVNTDEGRFRGRTLGGGNILFEIMFYNNKIIFRRL